MNKQKPREKNDELNVSPFFWFCFSPSFYKSFFIYLFKTQIKIIFHGFSLFLFLGWVVITEFRTKPFLKIDIDLGFKV
jgi:hypothetical protein